MKKTKNTLRLELYPLLTLLWLLRQKHDVVGKVSLIFDYRTCTHTEPMNSKVTATVQDWWRVDLLAVYHVTTVVAFNRLGSPLKLNSTRVSKSLIAYINYITLTLL